MTIFVSFAQLNKTALVVLFNNNAAYLELTIAALVYVSIVNLLIFSKSAKNVGLLTLYAAAQVLTHPYCVSLILNIRRIIDGQFDMHQCVMAAMGLVSDIISLSLFIVSICLGEISSGNESSSGGSSGSSSSGSSIGLSIGSGGR
ncbi:uncharacterized protein LOC26526384 [Drosophila erecta]|uniref:Uncharacterized protein n=1 Tax=Drosophila erecta TaxID=7220 RepID=A0A0Q5S5C0_DROER|nr:uncharacterized protein LOC26526384 [Drosophila erecta]KQS16001.1 uncharacterized protein Dere_GG26560 [Drosophila erecta]